MILCVARINFIFVIKRREPSSFEWQQIAQMIVNQIINEYYTLPAGQQTKIVLLLLIEKYWKK